MRRLLLVWVTLWLVGLSAVVRAEAANTSAGQRRELSTYERDSIRIALERIGGGSIETRPEGKQIEDLEIVTLEVLEARDPAPAFLNWFHVTSHDAIIKQELLLSVGQGYDQRLVEESERNLRSKPQLSVVLILALKGSAEDRVRLLVIVKDVWSLRLGWDAKFPGGRPYYLSLQPAETNLFGTHQMAAVNMAFTPNHYWLGGAYMYPRIAGSRINAHLGADVAFHCLTREVEGGAGRFQYGQPLYSAEAVWSWQVAATWSRRVTRPGSGVDENNNFKSICSDGRARELEVPVARDLDSGQVRSVVFPNQTRAEELRGQVVLTRSFFGTNKLNLSTGIEVDRNRQIRLRLEREQTRARTTTFGEDGQVIEQQTQPTDPEDYALARSRFHPYGQRRISPYVQLHAFANRWLRMINYDTLGLQEDWRMGHDVYLRLFPAFHPLSSHDWLGMFASAAYAWPLGGGFVKVLAGAQLELGQLREPVTFRDSEALLSEVQWQLGVHWVSPSFGLGRIVADLSSKYRPQRFLFADFYTGGDSRLRGYADSEFRGAGIVNANLEFRSRPVSLFEVNVGLVAFADAGGALDPVEVGASTAAVVNADPNSTQNFAGGTSLGFGLRFLAPQVDRDVFRVDFGFPLREGRIGFGWFASFEQAFEAPSAIPDVLLPQ